ncbi:hypothetical protein BJX68DRAFT_134108 [Aspergillus pseudodeflectus]|uniref:F-box domain-containing protein n=1 Tax=Aspergillus pseudodeflectus TaxID=176178 RepID=A0ABR4JZ32_9EURO
MILDFPPELIQLVLLHCTTPAFLQIAFTCRALYEIASSCREVLVSHLLRTPGPPLDVSSLSTSDIFPVLRSRAVKQLCDSQYNASCITLECGDTRPNAKASSLAVYGDDTLVLFTCRDRQDVVHIFRAQHGQVALLGRVRLPWIRPGSAEILKTAFDGHDLVYILYRFIPDVEEPSSSPEHIFVKQARDFGDNGQTVYLTCHSLQAPNEPVRVCAFPEHGRSEPSALAVADGGAFAISWCHPMLSTHSVVYYTIKVGSEYDVAPDIVGFFHTPRLLHKWLGGPLVTEMAFNDRSSQLLYSYPAKSLYASFQKIDRAGSPTLYENSTPVDFTDDLSLLFSIGVPFFGTHETNTQNGFEVCRWRYLSLGIATHREEKWTVACLLRSEATCRARTCGHRMNLERGRRLQDWTVMARLWGFRDATDSSLGCRVAASRLGTRIAVANWDVIYVWALEPGALIDGDPEAYYDPSWRSTSTGQIELQPIVLKLDAVCFQLRFTKIENELVAITDRGIMLWDLTPSGRGSKSRRLLDVGDTM